MAAEEVVLSGWFCQGNFAKSKSALPVSIQAAAASARKRRREGLLIRWRWMLKVL